MAQKLTMARPPANQRILAGELAVAAGGVEAAAVTVVVAVVAAAVAVAVAATAAAAIIDGAKRRLCFGALQPCRSYLQS
jgi:hypothetical protein